MANTPDRLQIYPRGFLGRQLPSGLTKKETPFYSQLNQKQFSFSIFDSSEKKRTGDPDIEKLFARYIRAEGNINSHAFREKIFKAAFNAFSTRDFHFWYQAQKASPFYGDYQQRFLEDTLKYLATGKRELNVETWASLLTLSVDVDPAGKENILVKEFFGEHIDGAGEKTPKNRDVVDILKLWWSKPAGVGDLLYTLHILFGNI